MEMNVRMKLPSLRFIYLWPVTAALFTGSLSVVYSAEAEVLEEVLVTADKRGATSVQDIPLSVQANKGDTLQESGSIDFMDYFRTIPGLSLNDTGPGEKQYVIRGVQSSGAGTVGLYLGEVIVTGFDNNPDIKMFDVDRIEVLRGPQGTTFGSSALSGTIRWMPNEPEYDRIASNVGVGIRSLRHSNDLGWQLDGMLNVPLIEDKLAVRFSGVVLDKAGYIDNRFEDDGNSEDTKAFRGMASWRITDDLEFSMFGMAQNMDVGARNFFNDTALMLPLSDTLNGQDLPGSYYSKVLTSAAFEDDIEIYNGKLVLDKSWGTLTGTYSIFDRTTFRKGAAEEGSELLFGLPADENPAYLGGGYDRKVTSSEIRFGSRWNGPIQVLAGVFLQNEDRDQATTFVFTDPVTGRDRDIAAEAARRETYTELDEFATFGEVILGITDRLTLTGGFRWFDQKVKQQINVLMGYIYLPGSGLQDPLHFSFSDTIFKGNLAYKVSDDVLAYVQVAEGYRAGGPNDRSAMDRANVFIPPGFESDSLINYEMGVKSNFLNNRLQLNGSIYFIDWSNIQVARQAIADDGNIFSYRGNGGGAEVKGIELELAAHPSDGLSIGGGLSYMDAKLTKDMPLAREGVTGDRIPYSPEISGNLNARYERPLFDGSMGFVAGDWSYYGDTTNNFRPSNFYYRKIGSYQVANIRGGIENEAGWSLILALDNVFDADDVISYTFDYTAVSFPPGVFLPDNKARPWPRTFSVTFRKQF